MLSEAMSLELMSWSSSLPWATVLSAASSPANERNPEELAALASALCSCPCLKECTEQQSIELARVCIASRYAAEQLVRLSTRGLRTACKMSKLIRS